MYPADNEHLQTRGLELAVEILAPPATAEADAMHALLVLRADQIEAYTAGSPEETEFNAIADALEAYEPKRWPDGKVPRNAWF